MGCLVSFPLRCTSSFQFPTTLVVLVPPPPYVLMTPASDEGIRWSPVSAFVPVSCHTHLPAPFSRSSPHTLFLPTSDSVADAQSRSRQRALAGSSRAGLAHSGTACVEALCIVSVHIIFFLHLSCSGEEHRAMEWPFLYEWITEVMMPAMTGRSGERQKRKTSKSNRNIIIRENFWSWHVLGSGGGSHPISR